MGSGVGELGGPACILRKFFWDGRRDGLRHCWTCGCPWRMGYHCQKLPGLGQTCKYGLQGELGVIGGHELWCLRLRLWWTSLPVAINWKVVVAVRRRKGEGLSCSGRGLGRKTAMRNTDVVCWYQVLSLREMGLPVEEMKCWEGRGGGVLRSSKRYAQSPLRGSGYLLSQALCVPIIFFKSPEQISYCACVFTSGPLLTNSWAWPQRTNQAYSQQSVREILESLTHRLWDVSPGEVGEPAFL